MLNKKEKAQKKALEKKTGKKLSDKQKRLEKLQAEMEKLNTPRQQMPQSFEEVPDRGVQKGGGRKAAPCCFVYCHVCRWSTMFTGEKKFGIKGLTTRYNNVIINSQNCEFVHIHERIAEDDH